MTDEFAAAFLAAQKEFPTIAKTKTATIPTKDGGSYKYKYADLGDVLASALPILHKHGIALLQPPVSEAGMVGVQTRLLHESGHVEDCGALLLHAGNNPQAAGSAMTYARRYAACAALGIVADEDDDGRAASQPVKEPSRNVKDDAKRGTNRLKALALELMGDPDEAKDLYIRALNDVELDPDKPVPADLQDKVRETLEEIAP